MPVDFTGDDVWEDTITGPSNADPATGLSVSDMGVLLANRTRYLYNRLLSNIFGETDTDLSEDTATSVYQQSALETIDITIAVEATIVAMLTARVTADSNGAKIRLTLWDDGPTLIATGEEVFFLEVDQLNFTALGLFPAVPAGTYKVRIEYAEQTGGGSMVFHGPATLVALMLGK